MKKIFTVFSSLVLFQNIAFADDLTSSLSGVLKQPYEPSFISIIGALVFVVCLIYITGIVYAKLTAMSSKTVKKHIKNNTQVTILSTSDLGNGKTLHVIEIGGKQMLIGASSSSVNLLCELPEEILEEERKTEMEVEIVTEPKIILYDEPTAGLDPISSTLIEDYIVRLKNETNAASIVVTHQMSTIRRTADSVLMLYNGKAVFEGSPDELCAEQTEYTRQFVNATIEGPMKMN